MGLLRLSRAEQGLERRFHRHLQQRHLPLPRRWRHLAVRQCRHHLGLRQQHGPITQLRRGSDHLRRRYRHRTLPLQGRRTNLGSRDRSRHLKGLRSAGPVPQIRHLAQLQGQRSDVPLHRAKKNARPEGKACLEIQRPQQGTEAGRDRRRFQLHQRLRLCSERLCEEDDVRRGRSGPLCLRRRRRHLDPAPQGQLRQSHRLAQLRRRRLDLPHGWSGPGACLDRCRSILQAHPFRTARPARREPHLLTQLQHRSDTLRRDLRRRRIQIHRPRQELDTLRPARKTALHRPRLLGEF